MLTLNGNSLALIIEHQMVVDYKHPGQKRNMVTNTWIVIKGERGHHELLHLQPARRHKTPVDIHTARCVCVHVPERATFVGPAEDACFLDEAV